MFNRHELIEKFNDLCQRLGIDPLLPTILALILLILIGTRNIKNWKKFSSYSKLLNIILWYALLLAISIYKITIYLNFPPN